MGMQQSTRVIASLSLAPAQLFRCPCEKLVDLCSGIFCVKDGLESMFGKEEGRDWLTWISHGE